MPIPRSQPIDRQLNQLVRLNKAIAASGICSRRAADNLIASGKVKVNGKQVTDYHMLVKLGHDSLSVNDKKLSVRPHEYILLHKPQSIVTTCKDEFNRQSILDLLPIKLRHLKPAGRLDYDSSGLILLTNNGALILSLSHPKHQVLKTYRVTVSGKCTPAAAKQLADGINLKETKTSKAKVNLLISNEEQSIIEITIAEGKNRQIRRMCAQLGLPVMNLIRTSIGKLQLENLASGKWRYLTKNEIDHLLKELKITSNTNLSGPYKKR